MNNNQSINKVSLFHFDGHKQIRTIFRPEDDSVLFCGKDVAEALGYKDTSQAIRKNCKRGRPVDGSFTAGGEQSMIFIPESDVYRLIMKSRLKTAEKFEEWVCDEVLPTIRKHGVYSQAVANSGLSPEVQALQLAHTEKVLNGATSILKAIDKGDRYGNLKPDDKKRLCELLGKDFNVAPEIIRLISENGLSSITPCHDHG